MVSCGEQESFHAGCAMTALNSTRHFGRRIYDQPTSKHDEVNQDDTPTTMSNLQSTCWLDLYLHTNRISSTDEFRSQCTRRKLRFSGTTNPKQPLIYDAGVVRLRAEPMAKIKVCKCRNPDEGPMNRRTMSRTCRNCGGFTVVNGRVVPKDGGR